MKVNAAVGNCANKVRQTAGVYQSDGNLIAAKRNIGFAFSELTMLYSKHPHLQIIIWGLLLLELESYFNPCCDFRWLTVIKYARAKASARRADIVHKIKLNVNLSQDRS